MHLFRINIIGLIFFMPKKYWKRAKEHVEEALHEYKEGKLTIGKSDKKVKNPKQAIAIGLSEARKEWEKVPPPPKENEKKKKDEKKKKSSSEK